MMRLCRFRCLVFLLAVCGGGVSSAQALVTVWSTAEVQPDGWRYVPALGAVYLPPETASREAVGTGTVKVRVPGQYMEFTIPDDPRWAFHRAYGWLRATAGSRVEDDGWWFIVQSGVPGVPGQWVEGDSWMWVDPDTFPKAYFVGDSFSALQGWGHLRTEERWDAFRWVYLYQFQTWYDMNRRALDDPWLDSAVRGRASYFESRLEDFVLEPLENEALAALPDWERTAYDLFAAVFQPLDLDSIVGEESGSGWSNAQKRYFVIPDQLRVAIVEIEAPLGLPPLDQEVRLKHLSSHRIHDFRPQLSFPNRRVLRAEPELLDAVNRYRGWPNSWEYVKTTAWFDAYLKPEMSPWAPPEFARLHTWPVVESIELTESLDRAFVGYRIHAYGYATEWRLEEDQWTFVRVISIAVE
jgi:hypothetical protein